MTPDEFQHLRDLSAADKAAQEALASIVAQYPAGLTVEGWRSWDYRHGALRSQRMEATADARDAAAALIAAMRNHLDDLLDIAEESQKSAVCPVCDVWQWIGPGGMISGHQHAGFTCPGGGKPLAGSRVATLTAERDAAIEEQDRLRSAAQAVLEVIDGAHMVVFDRRTGTDVCGPVEP